MPKDSLSESLQKATAIVMRFCLGRMSVEAFLEEYGNFYYYEALDGHEGSSGSLRRPMLRLAIELHKRIQEDVVNRVLLGSYSPQELMEAGRLDEAHARFKALEICSEVGARAIMEQISDPECAGER